MPQARVNGLDIEYTVEGSGEPLLLIMGLGAQLVYWPDGFCEALLHRGFQLIRFDNRDVGLSSKLSGAPQLDVRRLIAQRMLARPMRVPYLLRHMADDAAGLLDHLGVDRAHVLGVSMGGMIAQTLAIHHPQRVATLTSVMSHAGQLRHMLSRPAALRVLLGRAPRSRAEALDRAESFYRVVGSRGFPLNIEAQRERAGRAYDRCFYPPGFVRHIAAIVASRSRVAALRQLQLPTLVLHGSDDPLIRPAGGRATAKHIPGARLKIIQGMGHDLPAGAWSQIADAQASHALDRFDLREVVPPAQRPSQRAPTSFHPISVSFRSEGELRNSLTSPKG